jgi:hypothetical protein
MLKRRTSHCKHLQTLRRVTFSDCAICIRSVINLQLLSEYIIFHQKWWILAFVTIRLIGGREI